MMDLLQLAHDSACGAIAAMGFGVLFNVRFRALPGCAATGALALAIRSTATEQGLSLVGASFVAAMAVGIVVQSFPARIGASRNALAVAGCIPMVPGAIAARAILGLVAVAAERPAASTDTLVTALGFSLRAAFTIGALATGLAIPTFLPFLRRTKQAGRVNRDGGR